MQMQQAAERQFLERLAYRFDPSARARLTSHRADPLAFARERLGHALWPKQEAMLLSVRDNRRTVVPAGHGVSKTYCAAEAVCWWMESHEEAVAVTVAPTGRQVRSLIWSHIRDMARGAKLGGEVLETAHWKWPSALKFATGISPRRSSEEEIRGMLGYHSPHLLVVLEEAPGLNRLVWDAVDKLTVGVGDRVLAIGNPIQRAGPFWDACNSSRWNCIHVSCLEFPNVKEGREAIPGGASREWVEDQVEKHATPCSPDEVLGAAYESPGGIWWRAGETPDGAAGVLAFEWPPGSSAFYRPDAVFLSSVLGIAPEEGDDQLISFAWVDAAMNWVAVSDAPTVVSLDPSRYGKDASALCARKGARVLWVKRKQPRTPDPTGEQTTWLAEAYHSLGAVKAFVDVIGLGAGVVDLARNMGLNVVAVDFGAGADDPREFANKRAECAWRCREALRLGALSLPQDDVLAGDLVAPRFTRPERGHRRILIESKDTIRDRLGRSPDYGDALWLTFAEGKVELLPEGAREELVRAEAGRWGQAETPALALVRRGGGSRWRRERRRRW